MVRHMIEYEGYMGRHVSECRGLTGSGRLHNRYTIETATISPPRHCISYVLVLSTAMRRYLAAISPLYRRHLAAISPPSRRYLAWQGAMTVEV